MPTVVKAWTKTLYQSGERTFESALPIGCTGAKVIVDRTSLQGQEVPDAIFLDVSVSYDNGATWDYRGGVGIPDGVSGSRTESGFAPQFPQPDVARLVRVVFRNEAPVTVSVTATLLP